MTIPAPTFLVTGGGGYLGVRFVPLLVERVPGCRIIAISRREWPKNARASCIEVLHGDLRDSRIWEELPSSITHVFHLAATIPRKPEDKRTASVVTDNVGPVALLADFARRWPNLKQIIYSSSVSVYEQSNEPLKEDSPQRPADSYGASKLAGEVLLRSAESTGVATAALRFSSIYGYGQYPGTVLPLMIRRALDAQEIVVFGDGSRRQDFLHRDDAAGALLLAFQTQARGAFNIGSGVSTSMLDLAEAINRVFTLGTAKVLRQANVELNANGIVLDVTKATQNLGYRASVDLESGLRCIKNEMESSAA